MKKVYFVKINGRWIRLEGEDKSRIPWVDVVVITVTLCVMSAILLGVLA